MPRRQRRPLDGSCISDRDREPHVKYLVEVVIGVPDAKLEALLSAREKRRVRTTETTMGMERFWDVLCAATPLWKRFLAAVLVLLLLTGFSLAYVDPGSGSYFIVVFNLVALSGLLAGTLFVLHRCRGRRNRPPARETAARDGEEGD